MARAMRVHQSVGQVNFVTCDMVLGAEGEARQVEDLLDRLEPETLAVDLSVEDLGSLGDDEVDDPFLAAHTAAVEDQATEDPLAPYEAMLSWAGERDLEVHPVGSRSSVGIVKARRIKRTADTETEGIEDRHRDGLDALLDDAQVGPLARRRRESLADGLTNLLRREPPRTLAAFAFPWGEMVSADVRRELGLRRMEGEQVAGGWPE
jgi:hypothetical protein